ncbi:MAG: ABC transporter substrate-binding protein, partial [Actinomycetota bacterium]
MWEWLPSLPLRGAHSAAGCAQRDMKIVSLLPSATEILYALGLGDALEAVTAQCNHPPDAATKPIVSTTALPAGKRLDPREIDEEVRARIARGEPTARLDAARISEIRPDLIVTQDLCRVCAVPTGDVQDALDLLGCHAEVVSLDPGTLDEVIASIGILGDATGTAGRARELMEQLRARLAGVRDVVAGQGRPRTLALEWSDPPFSGGHWVPDMIEAAGGEALLATAGARSRQLAWEEIAREGPDVVIF